ncbi:MAG: DUF1592 domain-containing protein, partial [Sandaracinaceae bacterium]
PAPLRRLSHSEYQNTVALHFPGVDTTDLQLPREQQRFEFDNDVAAGTDGNLVESYVDLGETVAARIVEAPPEGLMPAENTVAAGEDFVRDLGRRLFRRPLSAEQVQAYSTFFRDPEPDSEYEDQVESTITLMLAAPEFLYRMESPVRELAPGQRGPLDAYSLASRLSFFLWESGPDDALLDAAEAGELSTEAGIEAQAERMLDDPRATAAFVRFHSQWLDFGRLDRVSKAEADNFDDAMRQSMLEESTRFVELVMFEERGTLNDLLTSDRSFIDARLATLYGVDAPAEDWSEVTLPNRAGVLTQATFLASHAHPDKPSPILRGVFMLERIMCSELGAPPADAEAAGQSAVETATGPLTNRQLYDLMTAEARCTSCHQEAGINPIGFSFENYDMMGRYITDDINTGTPIDASAQFREWEYNNAVELAHELAASEAVQRCAVRKWVRFAYGGGPMERASCYLDDLMEDFTASGGSFRDLQMSIVTHPSFAQTLGPEVAE